jgi:hypothetical protein
MEEVLEEIQLEAGRKISLLEMFWRATGAEQGGLLVGGAPTFTLSHMTIGTNKKCVFYQGNRSLDTMPPIDNR